MFCYVVVVVWILHRLSFIATVRFIYVLRVESISDLILYRKREREKRNERARTKEVGARTQVNEVKEQEWERDRREQECEREWREQKNASESEREKDKKPNTKKPNLVENHSIILAKCTFTSWILTMNS